MANIYAFTEPGCDLPAFVSLNIVDGKRILSVRSRGREIPATIELEADDLEDMAADILNHLHPHEVEEALKCGDVPYSLVPPGDTSVPVVPITGAQFMALFATSQDHDMAPNGQAKGRA